MPISRIKTDGIQDDAITSAKIGVDVIVADDLAANSVTVSEITNGAVTGPKLADNLNYDSGTLYLDSTNNRVGIGTTSPNSKLQVVGNVMADNGTAATPAYHFVGSSAIGMFTPDAGFSVAFSTASTERMRIDSSGNVGIGCTPDSPLEIRTATNSSSDTTYLKLSNLGENVGHIDFENGNGDLARITGTKEGSGVSGNDGILAFSTALNASLAERMRIDSNGNVGIGTATPAAGYDQRAGLNGNSQFILDASSTGGSGAGGAFLKFMGSNGTAVQIAAIDGSMTNGAIGSESGILALFTMNSGTSAERMRIDSNGRVGIGNLNPESRLHIGKAADTIETGIQFTNADGTGYVGMEGSSGNRFLGSSTNNMFVGTTGADGLEFATNNNVRMKIDSSGYVGIGTTSASEPLQVFNADFNGAVVRILNLRDTSNSNGIKVTIGTSGGASGTNSAHFHGNTNAVGNWYLYANGTTSYSSDERLKKNIETTRDGYLEDLAKLRVVKYNWNCDKDGDNKELGLIAQEVEQVFPNLVKDDTNPISEDDPTMYKQLKQSVLPMMLLKALQEANTKITALEARITGLESN